MVTDKDGKLGTFCRQAITPAQRMNLEFHVTGAHASLPESRTNRTILERSNMLAINRYMSKQQDGEKAA